MNIARKLTSLDRRYIFLIIALAVILPLIKPIGMPIPKTEEVKTIYNYIDNLPPGSAILVALDYDPAALAELYPMTLAILRHAYSKKIRVIGMTLWNTGATLGSIAMHEAAEGLAQEGIDYVYLGYVPGGANLIMSMGEDISLNFSKDYNGTPITQIPAMKGIKNFKDISLVVDLAAGATPELWIVYAGTRYKAPIAIGCTAVSAVGYYPFLNSKQIIGIIGGMKGAAEYEDLVGRKGSATAGMDSQSIAHIVIITLIIIANVCYFIIRRQERLRG
jgi:hypothetical protein